jgi:hypothetical protein
MMDTFLTFPQATEPAQTSTAPTAQPQALGATHKRDESDASSLYSQTRLSTFDAYQAFQKQEVRSTSAASNDTYNFSSTDDSRGTSMVYSQGERGPSESEAQLSAPQPQNSRLSLAPNAPDSSRLSVAPNGQEQRLSEFYDAYYRNSQLNPIQAVDAKRTVGRHSTIVEVETPLASPMFPKAMQHPSPGAAF